jgi:chromosomal replication initiation ATPase DnaA
MGTTEFAEEDINIAPVVEKAWTFDAIVFAVARKHGLCRGDLLGPSRMRHIYLARLELYAFLRAKGWSFPAIAKACKKKNHTTVLKALKRAKGKRP